MVNVKSMLDCSNEGRVSVPERTPVCSAVAILETRTEYITNDRADVIFIMLKSYCVDTTVVLCDAVALVQRVPISALPPVFFA